MRIMPMAQTQFQEAQTMLHKNSVVGHKKFIRQVPYGLFKPSVSLKETAVSSNNKVEIPAYPVLRSSAKTANIPVRARRLQPQKSIVSPAFDGRVLRLVRKSNWDEEGGRAISQIACRSALRFVRRVCGLNPNLPMPVVSPSKRGAVALTWRTKTQSITLFFTNVLRHEVAYRVEGIDFAYKNAVASRQQLIERISKIDGEVQAIGNNG